MAPAAMIVVFMSFGLLWLNYQRKQHFRRRKRRDASSTSHYSINLRVVLEVIRKVFLLRLVACATPPHSVHDFFISYLEHFYSYSTLEYGAMIAASAQLFNDLGNDVNVPKAPLKLLLDVLLAPDLQEQLSFCIAPYVSLFCHLFSHVRALDYEIVQSRCGIQI